MLSPLALYIHWPFCLSKCPYCDFNSHVRERLDQARFRAALRAELAWEAARLGPRRLTSIFFGGGTPSLMEPETVAALIADAQQFFGPEPDIEITLEANPTSVEAGRFAGYRAAGVNRVSLGVQALNDADLKTLGRMHTAEEAMQAVRIATSIFDRASFDLIYARPGQTPAQWRAELEEAVRRAPEHLSLYQLTIEHDTMFQKLVDAGRMIPPDADTGRDLWDVTQEIMNRAGMPAYEVSNHARPGAESRHNLIYWRYGEYAGVGPGAHGRLVVEGRGRLAQSTEKHPEMWLTVVEADGHGLVEDDLLSAGEQGDEMLVMGLRLAEGVDIRRFEALSGRKLDPRRIASLIEDGMVENAPDGRLRVTPEGFPVLNAVVADLAA